MLEPVAAKNCVAVAHCVFARRTFRAIVVLHYDLICMKTGISVRWRLGAYFSANEHAKGAMRGGPGAGDEHRTAVVKIF